MSFSSACVKLKVSPVNGNTLSSAGAFSNLSKIGPSALISSLISAILFPAPFGRIEMVERGSVKACGLAGEPGSAGFLSAGGSAGKGSDRSD